MGGLGFRGRGARLAGTRVRVVSGLKRAQIARIGENHPCSDRLLPNGHDASHLWDLGELCSMGVLVFGPTTADL